MFIYIIAYGIFSSMNDVILFKILEKINETECPICGVGCVLKNLDGRGMYKKYKYGFAPGRFRIIKNNKSCEPKNIKEAL